MNKNTKRTGKPSLSAGSPVHERTTSKTMLDTVLRELKICTVHLVPLILLAFLIVFGGRMGLLHAQDSNDSEMKISNSLQNPLCLVAVVAVLLHPLKNTLFFFTGFKYDVESINDISLAFPLGIPKNKFLAVATLITIQFPFACVDEFLFRAIFFRGFLLLIGINHTKPGLIGNLLGSVVTLGVAWKTTLSLTSVYLHVIYQSIYLVTQSIQATITVHYLHDAAMCLFYLIVISLGHYYEKDTNTGEVGFSLCDYDSRTTVEGFYVYPRSQCLPWRKKMIKFWKTLKISVLYKTIEEKIPLPPLSQGLTTRPKPISATMLRFLFMSACSALLASLLLTHQLSWTIIVNKHVDWILKILSQTSFGLWLPGLVLCVGLFYTFLKIADAVIPADDSAN